VADRGARFRAAGARAEALARRGLSAGLRALVFKRDRGARARTEREQGSFALGSRRTWRVVGALGGYSRGVGQAASRDPRAGQSPASPRIRRLAIIRPNPRNCYTRSDLFRSDRSWPGAAFSRLPRLAPHCNDRRTDFKCNAEMDWACAWSSTAEVAGSGGRSKGVQARGEKAALWRASCERICGLERQGIRIIELTRSHS